MFWRERSHIFTGSFWPKGEFHISHDASLHTILSSFRTHVMVSVQQGRDSWTAHLYIKHISILTPAKHHCQTYTEKSFIKKWQNTYTKTPTSSLQWILNWELLKCLKRFYTPVGVLRCAIAWHLKFATRGCDRKPPWETNFTWINETKKV